MNQRNIRAFLDKVYYQFRNLGQSSADRALNYAGTNAFLVGAEIQQGFLSGEYVPGPNTGLYALARSACRRARTAGWTRIAGTSSSRSSTRSTIGTRGCPACHDRRQCRAAGQPRAGAPLPRPILIGDNTLEVTMTDPIVPRPDLSMHLPCRFVRSDATTRAARKRRQRTPAASRPRIVAT